MRSTAAFTRLVRTLFVSGLVVNLLALAWIGARYGHAREYRFEVAVISVTWTVLIAGSALLALHLRTSSAPGK